MLGGRRRAKAASCPRSPPATAIVPPCASTLVTTCADYPAFSVNVISRESTRGDDTIWLIIELFEGVPLILDTIASDVSSQLADQSRLGVSITQESDIPEVGPAHRGLWQRIPNVTAVFQSTQECTVLMGSRFGCDRCRLFRLARDALVQVPRSRGFLPPIPAHQPPLRAIVSPITAGVVCPPTTRGNCHLPVPASPLAASAVAHFACQS